MAQLGDESSKSLLKRVLRIAVLLEASRLTGRIISRSLLRLEVLKQSPLWSEELEKVLDEARFAAGWTGRGEHLREQLLQSFSRQPLASQLDRSARGDDVFLAHEQSVPALLCKMSRLVVPGGCSLYCSVVLDDEQMSVTRSGRQLFRVFWRGTAAAHPEYVVLEESSAVDGRTRRILTRAESIYQIGSTLPRAGMVSCRRFLFGSREGTTLTVDSEICFHKPTPSGEFEFGSGRAFPFAVVSISRGIATPSWLKSASTVAIIIIFFNCKKRS
jgi:hypothetical protein